MFMTNDIQHIDNQQYTASSSLVLSQKSGYTVSYKGIVVGCGFFFFFYRELAVSA